MMLLLVSSNASVEDQGKFFTSSRLKISFQFSTHICRHSGELVYMDYMLLLNVCIIRNERLGRIYAYFGNTGFKNLATHLGTNRKSKEIIYNDVKDI